MTQSTDSLSFSDLVEGRSRDTIIRTAGLVILGWMASSDGDTSNEELAALRKICATLGSQGYVARTVALAVAAKPYNLGLACEVLRTALTDEGKHLFFQLCITMMHADGRVRHSELFILQLLADLFDLPVSTRSRLYREATGRPFPTAGDPSRADYWTRSRQDDRSGSSKHGHRREGSRHSGTTKRTRALAVLGLTEDATPSDVRKAYRLLSRIHHPDRFQSLGPEAAQAAHETFVRITAAYEELNS